MSMTYFKEIKKFEVGIGSDIEDTIKKAIEIANRDGCIVVFDFNGIDMEIREWMDVDEEIKKYKSRIGQNE